MEKQKVFIPVDVEDKKFRRNKEFMPPDIFKEMDNYIVYSLSNPFSNEIKYVGVSNSPYRRYYGHYSTRKSTQVSEWIFKLRDEGLKPKMRFLGKAITEKDGFKLEKFWIKKLTKEGHCLYNITEGGRYGKVVNKDYDVHNCKIDVELFLKIKNCLETENISTLDISRRFNVDKGTVYRIKNGEMFKNKMGEYKTSRPKINKEWYKSMGGADKMRIKTNVAQFSGKGELMRVFKDIQEASQVLGVKYDVIYYCCAGFSKKTRYNGIFKYISEEQYIQSLNIK